MTCPRCHGFMVEEVEVDQVDGIAAVAHRCLNCGHILFTQDCCDTTFDYQLAVGGKRK